MSKPRTNVKPRVDPYGQPVEFNGKHVTREDDSDVKLGPGAVKSETPEELAARLKVRDLERLGGRFGLPGVLVAVIVLRLLGVDLV